MQLTKTIEKEILKVYHAWLHSYLNGDVETYNLYLDDTYHFIGSTNNEEFLNKSDTTEFFRLTADQLAGKTDLRNQKTTLELFGELVFVTHVFDAWFLNGTEWAYYGRFRFSSVLQEKTAGWRFIYQHFSTTDSKTDEGDTIGFDKVNEENQQLREAIKRRTIELELKNQELAMEAALERVRAVALGMKTSQDILQICEIISKEISRFGEVHIRNVQLMIIYEKLGYYLCYQHFPAYKKEIIEKTYFAEDEIEKAIVERMLATKDGNFNGNLVGSQLDEFRDHRKEEEHFADPLLDQTDELFYYFLSIGTGGLGITFYKKPGQKTLDLFNKFHQVFSLSYKRFKDIEKAEAQAREAQIEAALEKVRSSSLAMQTPKDLEKVVMVIVERLQELGVVLDANGVILCTYFNDSRNVLHWIASPDFSFVGSYLLPYFDHPIFKDAWASKEKGDEYFSKSFSVELKNSFFEYAFEHSDYRYFPEEFKKWVFENDKHSLSFAWQKNSAILIPSHTGVVPNDGEKAILIRFSKVFEQAYVRFKDLEKSEAQAREAQIQLALERVRAKTMAMQRSEELAATASLLFSQISDLGIQVWSSGFQIWNDDDISTTAWMNSVGGEIQAGLRLPHTEDPYFKNILEARHNSDGFFVMESKGKELEDTYRYMFNIPEWEKAFGDIEASGFPIPKYQITHCVYFQQGYLMLITYEPNPEFWDILKRFGKAFEQTYTRFLDLQKAEAQAREAQIEAALERVRSRTMAMQKSEDLNEAAVDMFQQIQELGMQPWGCGFNIFDKDEKAVTQYMSLADGDISPPFRTPLTEDPFFISIYEARQKKVDLLVMESKEESLATTYRYMFSLPGSKEIFGDLEKSGFEMPRFQITHCAFFSQGYLVFITYEAVPEAHEIFKRFAKVFEQTYTRFLDLQKAEAQAREAQIEAALERVRSRTMAMQKSEELSDTAQVLFEQLNLLGVTHERINIGIVNESNQTIDFWVTEQGGKKLNNKFSGRISEPTTLSKAYAAWKSNKKSLVIDLQGKELASWLKFMAEEIKIPFDKAYLHDRRVQTSGFFSKGFLVLTSPEPLEEEALYLLEKFASVFDLTYTRFSDLKHAESQARRAQIEVALERVRARALAMQAPEELVEVANVMREEMGLLGVEELETSSIYINKEKEGEAECWYSLKNIRDGKKTDVADHFDLNYNKTWVGRQMLSFYQSDQKDTSILMQGENRKEWINYCSEESPVFQGYYGASIPDRTYHLSKFSHGAIGAATPSEISEESWELLRRAASVFSLAYSRFRDLSQAREDLKRLKRAKSKAEMALKELRSAQEQLIQQEKLASLGQLTAGIAHEIKNPLNFVNNFSDLSRELIEEVFLELGNLEDSDAKEEITAILNDVKSNLTKVHEHGTRADRIVTSMLQHSRASGSKREPKAFNPLVKEFVNLSFHGMRAGKTPINVDIDLQLDPKVGEVTLISEDFSRVILNLCNNAFDAMRDKLKTEDWRLKTEEGQKDEVTYIPKLTVKTALQKDKVILSFEDNGGGIPKEIQDKILQPFFTTKKGTEGTGLGLSITNDIIKSHGGELDIQSQPGSTIFKIHLTH